MPHACHFCLPAAFIRIKPGHCLRFAYGGFAQTDTSVSAATKAQEKNKDETMTVVATGNQRSSFEAPMMVTVIDGNSPQSQTATTAGDMLRHVPGVTVTGTGRSNGQDIMMRGYDRRGVLILVDGIRQGTDTGHINGTFLDPGLVKRIEVVRGPSALLYGSGALGGVISYETMDAADLLLPGHNTGYRVFGTGATGDHSLGMGASAYGKTDDLDGLISFGTRDIGDIRQGDGFNAPNDETISNVLAKGTWTIDDNQSLSGNLRYYNNRAQEPKNPQTPDVSSSNVLTDRSTIQRDAQLGYKLKPTGQDWLDADAKLYYSEVEINAHTDGSTDEARKQTTKGGKLENRTRLFADSFASHLFTYGSEAYRQEQTPGAQQRASRRPKSTSLPAGCRMRSLCVTCPSLSWLGRVMTTTKALATVMTTSTPTSGHPVVR